MVGRVGNECGDGVIGARRSMVCGAFVSAAPRGYDAMTGLSGWRTSTDSTRAAANKSHVVCVRGRIRAGLVKCGGVGGDEGGESDLHGNEECVVRSSSENDDQQKNQRAREGEFEEDANSKGAAVAVLDPERRYDTVLQELAAIQSDGPRKVAILGTRHMSYLHQQIVELYTYANLLLGNHVITSGAAGTNAAVIRGALRAEKPDLLTVVLPQSLSKQPLDTQDQLKKVRNLIEMTENDSLPLSVASQLCNSNIIERATHFIAFAFHDSDVVLESYREAKSTHKITTLLYLD